MTFPLVNLADVLSEPLSNGRSVPSRDGGFPVLRLTALRGDVVDLRERKEGAWTASDAERFLVSAGDFLVSRGNGSLDLVGRGALVPTTLSPVAYPDTMIRIRTDAERVEPRFLAFAWNAPAVRAQIESLARTTAGIYKINQAHLAAIRLPLPSLPEQHRVVDLLEDHLSRLDSGDEGLAMARRRLVALDRAALDRSFGLTGDAVALADLVDDISAGKSFGAASAPAADDEWGIIKVSAMTRGEFRPEENKAVTADRIDPRFEIKPGDLLVSRANTSSYVGASVLVGDVRRGLLLSDKSLRVVPAEGVDPVWLWRALQAPSARRQISDLATGTKDSMRNISQGALRSILLPLHDVGEQSAALATYGSVLERLRMTQRALEEQARRSSALRRAVLTAAFSGRLTGAASDEERAEELVDA